MTGAIDIAISDRRWIKAVPKIEHWCRMFVKATLATTPIGTTTSVSIALSDDATARDLNSRFRGIDKPTNVLSFPAHADTEAIGENGTLGDILVAYQTTAAEAKGAGISVADHLAHLIVHGVLHLCGYDHLLPRDAEAMETLEADILTRFGIADPYRGTVLEAAE